MIYCQLKARAKATLDQRLTLSDVADTLGRAGLTDVPVPCPAERGVWKLDALAVARLLHAACPGEDVTMLGPDVCYIHRVQAAHADPWKLLRTAAAFAILFIGSALGLTWFHSDVDMPGAMLRVVRVLNGGMVSDERLVTIPYVIGVALGVAVFYAVPFPKTVTPLEVKLGDYQEDMEKAEGREMPDD